MSHCTVQRAAGNLRRGWGWRLCAFALAGLILFACDETSSVSHKPQPASQPYVAPKVAVGVQGAQLNFIPAPGSRVELQGTATIGSWKSLSTDIHGKVVLDTNATALNALFDGIESTRVPPDPLALSVRSLPVGKISLSVMSLHGDSGGMDHDMQNALKAGQNPSIEYVFQQLQQATSQWDPRNHQACLKLRILGKLNMAGVGRLMTMDVIVQRDSRRHYLAHAQTALLMSDFSVTPPGKLFGLIKANNYVIVVFDLDFVLMEHSPGG
jgi:hypothetical protein